ncbi:ankyrin [Hypoxylon sp. FL1857]|nr:ankyrin [Hypoxylon sp. FL1857]
MATLDKMPPEILLIIANSCGYGWSSRDDQEVKQAHRDFASLALVNRTLHNVFDPALWQYNAMHGVYDENTSRTVSAVYWAASRNRVDVLEKAHRYQHPLGSCLSKDPIQRAAANGHDAACSWLLDHGVPVDLIPAERIDVGSPFPVPPWPIDHVSPDCSPLRTAMRRGRESTAVLLLKRGAKFWFKNHLMADSALHLAARYGLPAVIEHLVSAMGIDVDLLNDGSDTPLYHATQRRQNGETIQTLLNLGADINSEHNCQLPLSRAIMLGHFSNAMVLLDAGARVYPTRINEDTFSPLIICTWEEHKFNPSGVPDRNELARQDEVLRKLIAMGADLNQCFLGDTPLCTAIEGGTTSAVFELLKAGANVEKYRDIDGLRPFDLIWQEPESTEELIDKAILLVAAGASLDTGSPDPYGNTHLEYAVSRCIDNDPRPLAAILRSATERNMRDGYLDELLEFCLVDKHLEPAKMLLYHGATYPEASTHAFSWAMELNQEPDVTNRHDAFSFCLDFLSKDQLKSLFHDAMCTKNETHCQILISRGVLSLSEDFEPWLHLAAEFGSVALVRRLSGAGMDVDAFDDKFNTPMMTALKCGKTEVAELLFELGADPFYPGPDAECRQSPTSTQILSPFEFAIRENRTVDIRKWWTKSESESRPTGEFYIPRVLAHGPSLLEFLKDLQDPSNYELKVDENGLDVNWRRYCGILKFDTDEERVYTLTRAMASIQNPHEDTY